MLTIIFLCIVLLGAGLFITTLFYWYERKTDVTEDIPPLPFTVTNVFYLCLTLLYGFFCLLISAVAGIFLRFLPPTQQGHSLHGQTQTSPPILLIHGLYHDRSAWMLLRRSLRRMGFTRIHTMDYPARGMTMEKLAKILETKMTAMATRYPDTKPILVGHSLGGLIIQQWLAAYAGEERITGILTMGTPYKGSKMAGLSIGMLGQSLHPDNPFFTELAARKKPVSIPCVGIASRADSIVLPLQSLVPAQIGWRFVLSPPVSHIGMLFSPKTVRMVAWELHKMTLANI